jgi:2-amino-4-hydroxy-6-hydroxymethyldihydropteridine diphosphokinase
MKTIYLNIGSNRGDRKAFIEAAVTALAGKFASGIVRRAPLIESQPWGYSSQQPYLNLGVAIDLDDADMPAPMRVLEITQQTEREVSANSPHRDSAGNYIDRDIDIDIIDIDGVDISTPELTVPHPRAEARDFVMRPMQFLCPGWHPTKSRSAHLKKTIADMHRDTVEQFQAKKKLPIAVVLDNIRSLNNIGSIFRTSDAFMVDRVVLCGISATPPSPEIHKTALGAEQSVDWQYFPTTAEAVAALRADGWSICCLEQVHGSISLEQYSPKPGEKIALIAGNEVNGVDADIVAACDFYLEIPQAGTKHSLNVAVSTAIALWHLFSKINTIF